MKPRFALLVLGALMFYAPTAAQAGAFAKLSESEFNLRGQIEFGVQNKNSFVQKYELTTNGFIWTPRFIQIDSDVKFSDNVQSQFAAADSPKTNFSEYTLSMKVFPQHKFSPYVAVKKYTTLSRRDFGKDYETNTEVRQFGGNLKTRIPVSFDYNRMNNVVSDGTISVQDNFLLSAWKSGNNLAINYDKNTCDCGNKLSNYKYYKVSFDNSIEAANRRKRLNSVLSYSIRDGMSEKKDLFLAESLFLQHSSSLKSKYVYNFNSYAVDDYSFTNQKLRSELEYRFYRNLRITPALAFENKSNEAYKETLKKGELSADYRNRFYYGRKDAGGIYLFDFSFDCKISEEKSDGKGKLSGIVKMVDEKHQLSDETPQELNKRGINLDSVVVTDLSGLVVYRRSKDYFLFQERDNVYIVRNLSGDIPNNSEVSVEYDYIASSSVSGTSSAVAHGFSLSRSFFNNSFRLYTTQRTAVGFSRLAGIDRHNEVKTSLFGAVINVSQFDLTNEYIDYRQQGNDRYFYAKAMSSLNWHKEFSEIWFSARVTNNVYFNEDGNKSQLSLNILAQRIFDGGLIARTEIDYQTAKSGLPENGSELRTHIQLDLPVRAWLMTVQYDYNDENFSYYNQTNHRFYMGVIRQFELGVKGSER